MSDSSRRLDGTLNQAGSCTAAGRRVAWEHRKPQVIGHLCKHMYGNPVYVNGTGIRYSDGKVSVICVNKTQCAWCSDRVISKCIIPGTYCRCRAPWVTEIQQNRPDGSPRKLQLSKERINGEVKRELTVRCPWTSRHAHTHNIITQIYSELVRLTKLFLGLFCPFVLIPTQFWPQIVVSCKKKLVHIC